MFRIKSFTCVEDTLEPFDVKSFQLFKCKFEVSVTIITTIGFERIPNVVPKYLCLVNIFYRIEINRCTGCNPPRDKIWVLKCKPCHKHSALTAPKGHKFTIVLLRGILNIAAVELIPLELNEECIVSQSLFYSKITDVVVRE